MLQERISFDDASEKKVVSIRSEENEFEVVTIYNSNGSLDELWVYEWDGYNAKNSIRYNGQGEMLSRHEFDYDEQGYMTEFRFFGGDGKLLSKAVYDNDEKGRAMVCMSYDANENFEYKCENTWDGYDCIKSEYYNSAGVAIDKPHDPLEDAFRKT